MAKKTKYQLVTAAAKAHTDLNIFAAIISLLEGGVMSADVQPDDFRIIALCEKAQRKCLQRFDRATAALGAPYQGRHSN